MNVLNVQNLRNTKNITVGMNERRTEIVLIHWIHICMCAVLDGTQMYGIEFKIEWTDVENGGWSVGLQCMEHLYNIQ